MSDICVALGFHVAVEGEGLISIVVFTLRR